MYSETDMRMMGRALQLARMGAGFVSPNPMVGAVIADTEGRIIGEGYHRCWGGPHAEVNAVASVADKAVLRGATMYVTLEPCSHYGKTPPCARLLCECGFGKVVVACPDPFTEVSGRGISMLRDCGIDVRVGLMREQCEALNRKFIYAHTHRRPYVLLKWARTADGYMSAPGGVPLQISSAVSQVWMHRERAGADAIMAGTGTLRADNPSLTCRLWPSRRLCPVVLDRSGHVPLAAKVLGSKDLILLRDNLGPDQLLDRLYADYGITSLIVEGGAALLASFIDQDLWQEMRVETAAVRVGGGVSAPVPAHYPSYSGECGGHRIDRYYSEEVLSLFPALKGVSGPLKRR